MSRIKLLKKRLRHFESWKVTLSHLDTVSFPVNYGNLLILDGHCIGWDNVYYELFTAYFIVLHEESLRYVLPDFHRLQLLLDVFRYHASHSVIFVDEGFDLRFVAFRILVARGDQVSEETVLGHLDLAKFRVVFGV